MAERNDEHATLQLNLRLTPSEMAALDRMVEKRNKAEPGVYTRTSLLRSWMLKQLAAGR